MTHNNPAWFEDGKNVAKAASAKVWKKKPWRSRMRSPT